jgi:tetratricopeptide (TPR) repeat protein
VGVLMVAAVLFYLLAGGTTTKDKFDITSNTNKTGTLPSTSSASIKPSTIGKVEEPAVAAKDEEKAAAKEPPEEKAAKVAKKSSTAAAKDAPEPKAAGGGAPANTGKKAAQDHYSLGNQYFMQQRFDMSAEEYKAAIRSDASYAYAYRGLGAAYARLGKADIAVKQYEMYIKLVPNAPDAEQVKKIINDYYGK